MVRRKDEHITYARTHYSYKKSAYLVKDALSPCLPDKIGLFGTVISFETIQFSFDELERAGYMDVDSR